MSTWSLKLWQKRRLIWQQRRAAVISAPGDEAIDYSLPASTPVLRASYLAIGGPDLQRRSAFAQRPSLSGHGDLAQNHRGFSDNPN
jgi:hypothetical protein